MVYMEKRFGMLKHTKSWSFFSFIDLVILEQQITLEVCYSACPRMRGQYSSVRLTSLSIYWNVIKYESN